MDRGRGPQDRKCLLTLGNRECSVSRSPVPNGATPSLPLTSATGKLRTPATGHLSEITTIGLRVSSCSSAGPALGAATSCQRLVLTSMAQCGPAVLVTRAETNSVTPPSKAAEMVESVPSKRRRDEVSSGVPERVVAQP